MKGFIPGVLTLMFCLVIKVPVQASTASWQSQSIEKQPDSSVILPSERKSLKKRQDNNPPRSSFSTLDALLPQHQAASENTQYWIYDTVVRLIQDTDRDGYYSGFSLEIDADTHFAHSDVYARLYLQRGNQLYEYHETSDFHINSDQDNDRLVVETDLLDGFVPFDYHLVIELYESASHRLVAVRSEHHDNDLSFVPLESRDHERFVTSPRVVNRESGGSLSYLLLLFLLPLVRIRSQK